MWARLMVVVAKVSTQARLRAPSRQQVRGASCIAARVGTPDLTYNRHLLTSDQHNSNCYGRQIKLHTLSAGRVSTDNRCDVP